MNQRKNTYKHLGLEERILIEDRLNHGKTIRSIAKELDKSPSTILREIRKHSTNVRTSKNDCLNYTHCNYKGLCGNPDCKNKLCRRCSIPCNKFCSDYVKAYCDKLYATPYICNGCRNYNLCHYDKTVYIANQAEKNYRQTLVSARSGFDVTDAEFDTINTLASPMIKNGLSPYHVKQTYGEKLPISESTLRRMIDKNALDARNIDLREKVKRRPRQTTRNNSRNKTLSVQKVGHFYADYQKYILEHDVIVVEMDSVEGKKGEGPALLTLTFKSLSMQLAFIMEQHSSECVVQTLDKIEVSLGAELFANIFQVILTDNGHEFADVVGMETSCINGQRRTHIYFCEPNRSDQKGSCENHHKMIRYVIPKGSSLLPYNQADISLMTNHINSYKRKALFGKSAYDVAMSVLPQDFFWLLGLEVIPAEEILLKPSLIRKLS